jgi:hypothetical protein
VRQIELVDPNAIGERVGDIKVSLEEIYGIALPTDFEEIPPHRLYPTEAFLEKDKLALVFMKIIKEGYDVPIITISHRHNIFILDGHHRAYLFRKLTRDKIDTYVLRFPSNKPYRNIPKSDLENLSIKEVVPIDNPILKTWGQMLTLLKYYEALYQIPFHLREEDIALNQLVPTQSYVTRKQVDSIKELLVPIACVQEQDRFYILDGHARSIRAKEANLNTISCIILQPQAKVDFGIVKISMRMNLRGLEDLKILNTSQDRP